MILNETIINDSEEFNSFVIEAVGKLIPDNMKAKLGRRSVRRKMLDRYGDRAFLQPEKLKYPIVDPDTGKEHEGLKKAAYIRARQHQKGDIAAKAKDKMQESVEFLVEIEGHEGVYDIETIFDVIDVPPPPVVEPDVKEDFRDEEDNIIVVVGDSIRWTNDTGETCTGKIIEINGDFAVVEKSDGEKETVKL